VLVGGELFSFRAWEVTVAQISSVWRKLCASTRHEVMKENERSMAQLRAGTVRVEARRVGAELDAKGEERPGGATVPGLGAPRAGTGTCVGESYRVVGLVRAVLEGGERQRGPFALFHRHFTMKKQQQVRDIASQFAAGLLTNARRKWSRSVRALKPQQAS
jgi:hypothetical protein